MYSYEDEYICKSRTCILVANLVNNIGITLRETSEQTRFSRPTYFLVPTERNHHLSGAHCACGGSQLKDRFPSRRQFLSHVTGSFGTNGQAPKVNRAKLFRTMRKHCLKGGKKEVGSSVTLFGGRFVQKMTTFSIVSNQVFLLFIKGRYWVLDAIKIPTTVVVSEAMNDDVRGSWSSSVTFEVVRKHVIVSLVGVCFCVHLFFLARRTRPLLDPSLFILSNYVCAHLIKKSKFRSNARQQSTRALRSATKLSSPVLSLH
jgi:hypothetical protein